VENNGFKLKYDSDKEILGKELGLYLRRK